MNTSSQCESLFNDVNDLGSGVAAIGHLLRSSQEETYPFVLDGIGAVLHHLGKTMQGLNAQFVDVAYKNIRTMEINEEAEAARVKAAAERTRMLAELAKLFEGATSPGNTANTDEPKTYELASER